MQPPETGLELGGHWEREAPRSFFMVTDLVAPPSYEARFSQACPAPTSRSDCPPDAPVPTIAMTSALVTRSLSRPSPLVASRPLRRSVGQSTDPTWSGMQA